MSHRQLLLRRRGILARPGGYDPINDVAWSQVFWAEDPDWTDPGDGNLVDQWRDASGNGNHVNASGTERPTYNASWTALGGQPALKGDGTAVTMYEATQHEHAAHPFTITFVLSHALDGHDTWLRDWTRTETARARFGVQRWSSTAFREWLMYAGEGLGAGEEADDNGHLIICTFDGTNSALEVDGTTKATGDTGLTSLYEASLWARAGGSGSASAHSSAAIAYHSAIARLLTSDEKADLLAWSRDHYGTP